MTQTAIPAKIVPPRIEGVLQREELFRCLDACREKSLVWISGPGGAGKTTLVGSYLFARDLPFLWYQVDAGDLDPASFFYYLGLAGDNAKPARTQPLPLLTSEYLRGLPDFSRHFFARLFEGVSPPFVVVLDNVQEVPETAQLHQCLIDGFSRLPEGVSFICISRNEPPPCYSRLRANQEMAFVGWDQLRFSFSEFQHVVDRWGLASYPSDSLATMYEKMNGWIAGLQLLRKKTELNSLEAVADWDKTPEEIFHYFADQFFSQFDEDIQGFLLRTPFVPSMSARLAENLTGQVDAGSILEDLTRQNSFTTKRLESEAVYEYHPLFRGFLHDLAVSRFSVDELATLKACAAENLVAESRSDEAVVLFASLCDWRSLSALILENAQTLAAQGRFKTLIGWIELLPETGVVQNPWMLYWKAIGLKPIDVFASRTTFEQAYRLFRAERDPVGSYMTWAGLVETFIYLWGNFRDLDPWLEEFETITQQHPEFPTPEIEARVTYCVFSALLWRFSNRPEMLEWSLRAEKLAQMSPNPTFRIIAGSNLLKYYLWCCGDLAKADAFITVIRKIDRVSISPLALLLSKVMIATFHFFKNEMDACVDVVEEGLEMARNFGIHIMDTAFCAHAVYALLMCGERESALEYLARMGRQTNDQSHIDVAHYHYLCAWQQLEDGKFPHALENAQIAVERIEAAGTQQARGFAQYTYGVTLCEMGRYDEAQKALDKGRQYGLSMDNGYFEIAYHLCCALLGLRAGDREGAVEMVRMALPIGVAKGYDAIPWIGWYRSAFTELLHLALEHDISVDYAAKLVIQNELLPPQSFTRLSNWPWPVKINALGQFDIEDRDVSRRSSKKTEKRPLQLLKVILAAGPSGVSIDRAVEELSPEKEYSSAYNTYSVTLHRLRQRLGDERSVLTQNGRLFLNQDICWVDAWEFETLSRRVLSLSCDEAAEIHKVVAALDEAIDIFQGEFLAGQYDSTEQMTFSEKLSNQFSRLIFSKGKHLEAVGAWDEALCCYQGGLSHNSHHEPYFRALMRCYAQLGDTEGVHTTYQRCRSALVHELDLSPSMETERLYRKLVS